MYPKVKLTQHGEIISQVSLIHIKEYLKYRSSDQPARSWPLDTSPGEGTSQIRDVCCSSIDHGRAHT